MHDTKIRHDSRVQQALESLGIPYQVTNRGDFKVERVFENKRTLRVYIESNTDQYGFRKVRSISAITRLTSVEQINPNLLLDLLLDNGKQTFGAWGVTLTDTGKFSITFAAPISADADADTLEAVMCVVSQSAEEFKEQLEALAET